MSNNKNISSISKYTFNLSKFSKTSPTWRPPKKFIFHSRAFSLCQQSMYIYIIYVTQEFEMKIFRRIFPSVSEWRILEWRLLIKKTFSLASTYLFGIRDVRTRSTDATKTNTARLYLSTWVSEFSRVKSSQENSFVEEGGRA